MASRPRRSAVWEFFDEPVVVTELKSGKTIKKVQCKLCEQQLSDGGGTTNLANHLQAKHPQEYKRMIGESSGTTSKQTTLTEGVKRCSAQRAANITDLIAQFVCLDLRPLSVVDGEGFKNLMMFVEPGYKVPSRTHVTSVCHKKYDTIKSELLGHLNKATDVALTTDCWTSRAIQAYMTVTCHFLTSEWRLESKVLSTGEMPERHTGVNIHERMKTVSKEWKIYEKVIAVVHDNASNVVLASELLDEWGDLPCFAHTLQLAVNAGLGLAIISRLSSMCRKIVGHFKHSALAMTALRERQRVMDIPQHSLMQDVATRWNSTYFMYERLAEQRWAIYAVIHDEKVTSADNRHLDLTSDQWNLLSQMIVVLKPLQIATTALCKEQNVSASLIFPVLNGLLNCHLKMSDNDLVTVKRFKEVVKKDLEDRFPFDPDNVSVIAAAVDPRYKHLQFFTNEQRKEVHDVIQRKVEALCEKENSEASTSELSEDVLEPQPKRKKETAMSFLLGVTSQDDCSSWKEELSIFEREPQTHHDEDALLWWKTNEHRFPNIAKIARRYLCCPATSVPSERIFSTAGNIITNKRCSLTPENADMLIFLNKNL